MKSNSQFCAVVLVGLLSSAGPLHGQDIQTISHGNKVDINSSLARRGHTIVEFYADW